MDSVTNRILPVNVPITEQNGMDLINACRNAAIAQSMYYYGIYNGDKCYVGKLDDDHLTDAGGVKPDSECNMPCGNDNTGNDKIPKCGASDKISVYQIVSLHPVIILIKRTGIIRSHTLFLFSLMAILENLLIFIIFSSTITLVSISLQQDMQQCHHS
jgi:hypothetical protein